MAEIDAYRELIKILKREYLGDGKFKVEFLAALKVKTGNSNLGELCECIMNDQKYSKKIVIKL